MIEQILYTACVTPFTENGINIDYVSLENLLRKQDNAGNGIMVFGSTGEGLSISAQEQQEVLQFICKLKLNSKIIVGVPNYNFIAALDWIGFCNSLPIHGYMMTTPVYTKPGIIGQTKWFEALLEKSHHPAMLYNIPGRAGVKLHHETVLNLSNHPRFVAIKDSGGALGEMINYQIAAPNVAIYCGDDYLMPAMAAEGAKGLISVASNAWPQAVRRYVIDALGKNTKNKKDKIWWKACRALFATTNPIPIKALLNEIGLIASNAVRLALSADDFQSINDLMFYHKIISALDGKEIISDGHFINVA